MERIASFSVDHTTLLPGIYLSRADGDILTYDIRTRRPNTEAVMDNDAIHTMEHLFATYVRNSPERDSIVYFGPMGCRTGFYFLTRALPHKDALRLTREAMRFIADFTGPVPGVSAAECGNYREHSLEKAKQEAARFLPRIETWDEAKLQY